MNIREQVSYWKTGSTYDLETAKALFEKERYPYCLYFCHLALEKLLKALWVLLKNEHPPKVHNLAFLAEKLPMQLDETILDFFAELNEFNLEARYPDLKRSLYTRADQEYTVHYLEKTRETMDWLTRKLSES
jgi:HEPN domain-containing protein